jgi:pterin-4a-carbinolamine dehydratase
MAGPLRGWRLTELLFSPMPAMADNRVRAEGEPCHSHAEGGLTERDSQLAARIQELDQPA